MMQTLKSLKSIVMRNALLFESKILPKIMAFVILVWAIVGLWFLYSYFTKILNCIYAHFFRGFRKDLKSAYGEWILVVVGSTQNCETDTLQISAILQYLVRRGHKVLLLAPSNPSVTKLTTGIPCASMKAVLVDTSLSAYHKVTDLAEKAIADLKLPKGESVRALVMFNASSPASVDGKSTRESLHLMLGESLAVPAALSHLIITGADDTGKDCLIASAHSMAGLLSYPTDYHSPSLMHGACQHFQHILTKSLSNSAGRRPGSRFQSLVSMRTPSWENSPSRLLLTSDASYAVDFYWALGREPCIAPNFLHAVIIWFAVTLPQAIVSPILSLFTSSARNKKVA